MVWKNYVNLPLCLPFSALVWPYKMIWVIWVLFWRRRDRGSVRGKQQNMELAYKSQSITVYNRAWVGKGGLGLCGLDQTGRTLSTYQGSCDTIHSVFLVLFWLGMDLEKQKDGATDMHIWNCLEWSEDLFGIVFVRQTLPELGVHGQKFIFHHTMAVSTVSLVEEGGKRQS